MTQGKVEMMYCGGLRSGLSDRPMAGMSLSVTRITMFPLLVWIERDNTLPISEFGGNPVV